MTETLLEAALARRTANNNQDLRAEEAGNGLEEVETKTRERLLLSATTIQVIKGGARAEADYQKRGESKRNPSVEQVGKERSC